MRSVLIVAAIIASMILLKIFVLDKGKNEEKINLSREDEEAKDWIKRAAGIFKTGENSSYMDTLMEARWVPNIGLPDEAETRRLSDRVALRRSLDKMERAFDREGELGALDEFEAQAATLLTNPQTRDAFDLSKEDPAVRDRYGRLTQTITYIKVETGRFTVNFDNNIVSSLESTKTRPQWAGS